MRLRGEIVGIDGDKVIIHAPFHNPAEYIRKGFRTCEVWMDDGRHISIDQRKKAYATFGDIARYTGHMPDEIKALAKYDFIALTGCDYFSMSDVDMTTAREFLSYLIDFCIEWDIPTKDNPLDRAPDISRYIYACLINKKCVVCGRKAELHHVDRVGMGRNRREITHEGMRAQPLCPMHHREAHDLGQPRFDERYHVFGIKLDAELCGVWRVRGSKT